MKFKSRVDKKRSVWKKGHTRKNRFKNPAFFSLPHTYLAKVLNIPKSTAEYYRFIAIKSKFIISKSDFEILDVQGKEINLFKKYHDNSSNLRVLNGNLHKQKDNKLFSKIIIRTKKKLKKNLKLHGNFLYR